jgi:nicotinate dehydrogenase subunit A
MKTCVAPTSACDRTRGMWVNGQAVSALMGVLESVSASVSAPVPAPLETSSIPHPPLGIPCQQSLLLFLRNDLGLNGPKYGCGLGQCGACTVLVDGRAARACVIPADGLPGREVTTLEGLTRAKACGGGEGGGGGGGGVGGGGDGDCGAGVRLDREAHPVLHPVQQAFADTQAAQCGYCLNGMVMMTVALLAEVPNPSDTQIRQHLSHNLCRCGTHIEILRAVHRAAELMAEVAP